MFTLLILFFKQKIMKDRAFSTGNVEYLDKVGLSTPDSWKGKSRLCHVSSLIGVVVVLGIILEPCISSHIFLV